MSAQTESSNLADLGQAQRDRLSYIELRLRFMGEIRRSDLVNRCGIQSAAATRDFKLYKELAPDNIDYDSRAKIYVVGKQFMPLFSYPVSRVLAWLTQGFGDGEPVIVESEMADGAPDRLTQPSLDVLAAVTRAIHLRCPLSVNYHSLSSGLTQRQIVPFALIDTGLRWHVRAYDRLSKSFRDFVITRITEPVVETGLSVEKHELSDKDIQWTRIVELELVPHPDQPRPEITELDYGMVDGRLRLRMRAAMAGYTLRKWCVDCSPDHRLRGHEYRLWLTDPLTLYGVETAVLAPGYEVPH
jgi:hypothetical protein